MSNKWLILMTMTCLLAVCLCNLQKKNCIKPAVFKDVGEVADYVKCLKTITGSPPYGKRSVSQPSLFFQKLLRDYDPDYLQELVYRVLKAERELQA